MSTTPGIPKVTYTTTGGDIEALHASFDAALARVREASGARYPLIVDGAPLWPSDQPPLVDVSPIDTSWVLGHFAAATPTHVDAALRGAHAAQHGWGRLPWTARVAILHRAAALVRERKFDLAAILSVEVGKSRFESMGEAEESADLIDYYCLQIEDAGGYVREMARLTSAERNTDVLRPFGVFACIAPFNFPLALSAGMSGAALAGGNAVVYKPAEDTPWIGHELATIYRDAGVPAGVFQCLMGHREDIGDPLWRHPLVDGVVFTGSRAVGLRIHRGLAEGPFIKPCVMELGGKNAVTVMDSADLDAAAEGTVRSAFGLQNQKCSAASRVYVHRAVADAFTDLLLEKTRALRIGDPSRRDIDFGPVINGRAVERYLDAVRRAALDADGGTHGPRGEILMGGARLTTAGFEKGHYVAPTIARLPLAHPLFFEELFVPLLAIGIVDSLGEALAETNKTEYGLTAGIFTGRAEELEHFFDEVEAGVCYANRRSGATTGAWPGAQPFCGWKGSGSTGKGGCGPYYVAQFMREQSRTVIQ